MPQNSSSACKPAGRFSAAASVLLALPGAAHAGISETGRLLASEPSAWTIDIRSLLGLLVPLCLIVLYGIKRRHPELGLFPVPPSLIPQNSPSRLRQSH